MCFSLLEAKNVLFTLRLKKTPKQQTTQHSSSKQHWNQLVILQPKNPTYVQACINRISEWAPDARG